MTPLVVHVVRPYATEQEYLQEEAWSIDARSMLLVDVEPLPADTAVLFDIALADGHKPIRAEGRVVGAVAPDGARPGGLRIRFKRFGAATKAFIERAVKLKTAQGEPERARQVGAERPSAPEGERVSLVEIERLSAVDLEPPSPAAAPVAPPPEPESGVTSRRPALVAAPPNRDELLARLRSRQKAS